MTEQTQTSGAGKVPPKDPKMITSSEGEGFPYELYAPAIEGRIIRPKSKPRIIRGDDE